jgi:hypothetical protein
VRRYRVAVLGYATYDPAVGFQATVVAMSGACVPQADVTSASASLAAHKVTCIPLLLNPASPQRVWAPLGTTRLFASL